MDFIARADVHTEVIQAFSFYFKADSAGTISYCLTCRETLQPTLITNAGSGQRRTRETDAYEGYNVDTTGTFRIIGGLGAKTRTKIYNRHNYLERIRKVELTCANAVP